MVLHIKKRLRMKVKKDTVLFFLFTFMLLLLVFIVFWVGEGVSRERNNNNVPDISTEYENFGGSETWIEGEEEDSSNGSLVW